MDKEELYQKLLTKVIMFLAYKPRTRKEISLRLEKYLTLGKGLSDADRKENTDRIFSYLDENKLIDDREYARLYIDSKTKGKRILGRKSIQNKLMAKGISKDDAAAFIGEAVSEEDELSVAVKALLTKYKITDSGESAKNIGKAEYDKMGRFLLARGFSYVTAKQAVDYLLKRP
jgi:SOS response regulatory protein OraA/RecX